MLVSIEFQYRLFFYRAIYYNGLKKVPSFFNNVHRMCVYAPRRIENINITTKNVFVYNALDVRFVLDGTPRSFFFKFIRLLSKNVESEWPRVRGL